MKPPKCTRKDAFQVEEELCVSDKTGPIAKILEAKYKPADLEELMEKLTTTKQQQQQQITSNARQKNGLVEGTQGLWKGSLYKIDMQDNAKPHHTCLYRILQAYKQTF